MYKRSIDDGATWSELKLFYSNSSTEEVNIVGNAAPVQDVNNGRIWMPFCRNNEEVHISYSDDDGVSWSLPVYQPQLVLDDWKWIGLGPPGGLQLRSATAAAGGEEIKGRLLLPGYHTVKWKGDGCASHGHTVYSDDAGETWQLGSVDFGAPLLANECQAVQLTNGSVLINARTVSNNRVQVLSNDGGITFEPPTVADTLVQPLEGCEGSIISATPATRTATTTNDNKTASHSSTLFFSVPFTHTVTRVNMTLFRSDDEGATWQTFAAVDQGAVAYSSLQVQHLPGAAPARIKTAASTITPTDGTGTTIVVVELLYERSNTTQLVFDPDQIVYWRVPVAV